MLRSNAAQVEAETIDLEDESVFIQKSVYFGNNFKHDNTMVWSKLKNALLDKPGYNHISQFNNSKHGCNAWKELIVFYEGENYLKNLREIAFNKLQNTFYRGETNCFTFEKYINIHKQAHKMLQDAQFSDGAGLDNSMKVQYFRAGIKAEAGIEVALSTSRSNAQYDDFDTLISYLASEVEHHKMRKAQLHNSVKHVSGVQRRNNHNNPTNNKKGENNKSKQVLFKIVDGRRVEGCFYSKQEFQKMTPKQRAMVVELKRKSKGSSGTSTTRNTSQVTTDDLITMGDAIVAGVARAAKDNINAPNTVVTSIPDSTSNTQVTNQARAQAVSGSVGNVFCNRSSNKCPCQS